MPESRTRRKRKPHTKRRDRRGEAHARETQAAQKRAEVKQISPEVYRRRRVFGWSLVVLGVVVGVQHLLSHMGLFTLISRGTDDLIAGYPLAGLLAIGGAIVLSKA